MQDHSTRYDYTPPGLQNPKLDVCFPSLVEKDPNEVAWPWLRKKTPHKWRVDNRSAKPSIGVLSHEEAVLLHNLALPFKGLPGLEIGCHLAWSTAHLIAAGLVLDVIDPALGEGKHFDAVRLSLSKVSDYCSNDVIPAELYAGYSPSIMKAVAAVRGKPWSFAFIDGFHDGNAPTLDAEAVLPYMASDCMVVFHDLLCPSVEAGFEFFKKHGWNGQVFNTSQVMGVAWRGAIELPNYISDPNMPPLEQARRETKKNYAENIKSSANAGSIEKIV